MSIDMTKGDMKLAMRREPVTLNEPVQNHYAIKRHALLRRKALGVKECRVMALTCQIRK